MDVVSVTQRIGATATVVQQTDFHRKVHLEHVDNWDFRHSLQPRTHLAVHHAKRTLVHFACGVSLLTHRVCSDVDLIG